MFREQAKWQKFIDIFCAFYIAYIIEFSRFNTPFRCGKF